MSGQDMSKYKPLLIESIREIRQLKERLSERAASPRREPIAIVGAGCRLPGADGLNAYWDFLLRGGDGVREIPPDRWAVDEHFDPDPTRIGKIYTRSAGFIDAIDQFDAGFFGISPREAAAMDPQHRLLLEVAWEALENAAIVPAHLRDTRTGVYIGMMGQDYTHLNRDAQHLDLHTGVGTLPSVAAGRLAYWLGVYGPTLSIDTACSSSLVSIHLACQDLRSGEADVALAGGVNLILSPFVMMTISAARMLSPDGRCKTFDQSADGFGRGEGCGIVVLKRLSDAQRDRDRILAVIQGTAINHDGRSAGLTVPSQGAQTAVIRQALADAGVSGDDVQYLEAHGTGTSLGDPIEIAAAAEAYGADHGRAQRLVVGSVKTNFGHLEGAAGVASLLKTALVLRAGVIPPHLRLTRPNPHIDWDALSISVPLTTRPWPETTGLRMAGVSSFGISGTNAHAILSEPPLVDKPPFTATLCRLPLMLSAQTPNALRDKATDLMRYLAGVSTQRPRLEDVSYTLLFGRQHFEHRAVFIVADLEDAVDALDAFAQGRPNSQCRVGQVPRGQHASKLFHRFSQEMTERSLACRDQAEPLEEILFGLADLYCQGHDPSWPLLFSGLPVRRIELPTYPFQRQRYWLEASAPVAGLGSGVATLHPLLHRNTSDFMEQRYSSRFDGSEFFLSDHVVQGKRVLPGVVYLEMAREALERASGEALDGVRLKDVVWLRPLVVDVDPMEVHIGLFPQEDGSVAYEIYRDAEDGETVSHSQGRIEAIGITGEHRLDVPALRTQCTRGEWSDSECYARLARSGLHYGTAHRGIERLYMGEGQVLARLILPPSVASSAETYVLHPSLLDSALQSLVGLLSDSEEHEGRTSLPFALEALEILSGCSERMWSVARFSAGSQASDRVQKFDIDLCDDTGRVCMRLRGFTARVLEGGVLAAGGETARTLLWQSQWQTSPAHGGEIPGYHERLILLCDGKIDAQLLSARLGARCERLPEDYPTQAERVLNRLQALPRNKPSSPVLVQVVVPAEGPHQVSAGLAGLLKSARLENPKLIGQTIAVDQDEELEHLASKLEENAGHPQDTEIRYDRDTRQVLAWSELKGTQPVQPWKAGGVYLITGGLGGLGRLFAKEIAERAPGATLMLTGRRELDDAGWQQVRELEALGATVQYRAVDVSDRDAVRQLVLQIQEEHEGLNGIVHSAGVLRDSLLMNKTAEELAAVLAPKVAGLINLDEASREVELDCFVCFSSISAVRGNVGQADYAAANGFMDAYARYRNGLVERGLRHGRTVSVNWPLWREGGMRIDAATERAMTQATGLGAMSSADGIDALYRAWGSGLDRVAVVAGDPARMRQALEGPAVAVEAPRLDETPRLTPTIDVDIPVAEGVADSTVELLGKAGLYFRKLLADELHLQLVNVELDTPLEVYGIDSILVMNLTAQLESVFGILSKTLFFEYLTLRELTSYFAEHYTPQLKSLLGMMAPTARVALAEPPPAKARAVSAMPVHRAARRHLTKSVTRRAAATPAVQESGIAIIGIAGNYPQARNLRTFWENLCNGVDSITEIPPERWDHGPYFDPDKNNPNTTYTKWGGFIDGVDEFDSLFFNISPREAEQTDPQERLFLQCAYSALEDAGYTRETLEHYQTHGMRGNVGVYVGVMGDEYQLFAAQQQARGNLVTVSTRLASIANRVSYFLNLHGPSMALDTMCSSSLTAIHLACESLQRGSCGLAIAGGVNLSIHPNKYLMLGQGKFASSKGRCESFGIGGDGYVPGEGIGAVILKPLAKAEADGDHIYGVIKATSLNHGGRTNGYTVPNPVAQADMVAHAIEQAGIHPRTISYIEAHGTGTALGDPIEITGLSKAFDQYTQDRQYCAIGSVKSNIGHCEGAAGIVGLTKILLQMKHGQLVPSLHSRVLNPNIDFAQTPFVVQQALSEWKRPVLDIDGVRREYPRIAGLSSFGAGGSNAHVIVEEYRPMQRSDGYELPVGQPVLVLLSAKNAERLQEHVRQLLEAVERGVVAEENLADAAYTLQVGREVMEVRLALAVESVEALRDKLQRVLQGEEALNDVYRGEVKKHKAEVAFFTADEDLMSTIETWLVKGKHSKLLELWVKGLSFDWSKLYGERKPQRISLPTYPFARERYWLPQFEGWMPVHTLAPAGAGALHPLLHRNTSDFMKQRYSSRFDGSEFFLSDHVVQGQKVLPGAAYLEMARAALQLTIGANSGGVRLRNVVWLRPLMVDSEAVEAHVGLSPQDDGSVAYEIYRDAGEDEAISHSQGLIEVIESSAAVKMDVAALRAQCDKGEWAGSECYERFAALGLNYGPAHQAIERLYVGEGQALARLILPSSVASSAQTYILHPSLLDSALQSLIGLMSAGEEHAGRISLPFALEELEVLGGCSERMWSLARFSAGSQAGDRVQKFDIDLCDDEGRVCVCLRGFSTRALEGTSPGLLPSDVAADETALVGELTLAPVWEAMAPPDNESWPATDQGIVILGEDEDALRVLLDRYPGAMICILDRADSIEAIADKLREQDAFSHVFWIVTPLPCADLRSDEIASAQKSGAVLGFRIVKALLSLGRDRMALGLTVVTTQSQSIASLQPIFPAHASVHGLIGSTAKEYPNWRVRLIDFPADEQWPLSSLLALPADAAGNAYLYRHGQWHQQRLIRCTLPAPEQPVYRRNGVYVILGGAGGIGEAYSEHLVRHYQAQIVWIGRRAEDATITEKCDRIAVHGVRPHYIRADAANAVELVAAYEQIKARFGEIHGVVHAMLVLADQSLVRMDEARFVSALIPKIDASINLVHAFGEEALDFVLFFSSMQSVSKAPGQSNYAAGSTFVDAYARAIGQTFPWKVKVVNWGYWGSIGVVASEEYRRRMEQFGIDSIEPPEAMEVLNRLLSASVDQVMFLKTKSKESALARGSVEGETLRALPLSSQPAADLLQSTRQPLPMALDTKSSDYQESEQSAAGVLFAQLSGLGGFDASPITVDALQAKWSMPALYKPWLTMSLDILSAHGFLVRRADGWALAAQEAPATEALWQAWEWRKAKFQDDPDYGAILRLIDIGLRALPSILTGQISATTVLFPNASVSLIEGLYKNNRIVDFFNEVLSEVLITEVEDRLRRDPAARLRVFEIGAGTGGTSALLFERLAPYAAHIEEYCYTDISRAFLLHAQDKYLQKAPYLRTRLFNVEQPLSAQGLELASYDFVVATNVLHATQDMRRTLRNTKALLKESGVLLVNELIAFNLFTHLTTGLLEGWWLHTDSALRIAGSPALDPQTWRFLLSTEGYEDITFPAFDARNYGQQVIAARSDGVVRQAVASVPALAGHARQAAMRSNVTAPPALPSAPPASTLPKAVSTAAMGAGELEGKLQAALAEVVSLQLKIRLEDIGDDVTLNELGFDSITITAFANALNSRYGLDLAPTVLFEHPTLAGLSRYLVVNHRSVLQPYFGVAVAQALVPMPALPSTPPASTLPKAVSTAAMGVGELEGKLQAALAAVVSSQLKVRLEDIGDDVTLNELGFDSITITAFANALNRRYGLDLAPTVLFEHPTLADLSRYLVANHRSVLQPHFGVVVAQTPASVSMRMAPAPSIVSAPKRGRLAWAGPSAVTTAMPSRAGAPEPVAIIGVSGKFPQAADLDELWANLEAGRDSIGEIPNSRWDWSALRDYEGGGSHTHIKHAGLIDGIDEFDPLFFGISPREAESIDPQQRLLLMHAWKAIEDAGYAPHSLSGSQTALFVGTTSSGYGERLGQITQTIEGYTSTGIVASIGPSRMSYLLNLHGPSEPVETACSSALVAIHRVVQLLQSGQCELAIAGGVNTLLSPEAHISFSKAGMLSPDGRCKTFSDQANGYVRGEGVGMLVLKPLSAAERDGDHIYALIRGTAENHGGKANSLTSPNPRAQADLIKAAIKQSGVELSSISYIEAHGTGTPLGDPIEVQGLKTAFQELASERQQPLPMASCGLGTIKTNIGHLELAAGVAGVIKVLLQMRHKKLVPSLHCETVNPYIDLEGSPFYVVREVREWAAIQGSDGRPQPRRAGVSSFGFGGVNAHVVLEEYIPKGLERPTALVDEAHPALIVLSAKNGEQLREQARQLLVAVERGVVTQQNLTDTAYTLQVGRDAMEVRLALVVETTEALRDKLRQVVQSEESIDGVHRGEIRKHKAEVAFFTADEDLSETIETWLSKGKYGKLLELWAKGLPFDWNKLYGERKPRRISLPTYPFARERYWMPQVESQASAHVVAQVLHPLLHRNTSDLSEQRFSTRFSGEEFFLSDHVVQGKKVLPGVAYLEMAREALVQGAGVAAGAGVRLKDVVWLRPFVVDGQAQELHVGLYPESDRTIGFEIYSGEDDVHSQGRAEAFAVEVEQKLDLDALHAQCARAHMSGTGCYERFIALGLAYGPAHRAIEQLYVGEGQALARLVLPESVAGTWEQYVLHPSLLDAALQSVIGLAGEEGQGQLALPFAVREVEVMGGCAQRMWALVRPGAGSHSGDRVHKFDIDLCDDEGVVAVRIKGFATRVIEGESSAAGSEAVESQPLQDALAEVANAEPGTADQALLKDKALPYFKRQLAETFKLPVERIEANAPLERYGINSILVTQLTSKLEKSFGVLSKTLLFEYQTLNALVGYFLAEHRAQLIELFKLGGDDATKASGKPARAAISLPAEMPRRRRGRFALSSTAFARPDADAHAKRDIAIIGLAGRYPQARDLKVFWENLRAGKDSITEIPVERWDHSRYFDPDKNKQGTTYSKWGGFIDGVDEFDPQFFHISLREARAMDPQERLFLQCTHAALEDAGYTRETLEQCSRERAIGVYVGVMYEEYPLYGAQAQTRGNNVALGGSLASIANRVSYYFNLHGPSLGMDSMCSSSLTALHLACESLRQGQCDLAIAGGVNVTIHPNKYLLLAQGKFVSSKGRCESFGLGGDGYVPGEGVGAVILKPLDQAITDGDHIYGVIKATTLNHGGKTNGYTVPNPVAQAAVIGRALKESGIDVRTISYLEAHGTGTSLGDPIEITGLSKAFGASAQNRQYCAIGSVKSNIGHCEGAAGIAGLTKVLLQMQHGQLVPSLHSRELNPHIDFAQTPFVVQQELAEWHRPVVEIDGVRREYPRIAGISSFGAGGSNAHVIVEEYVAPLAERNDERTGPVAVVLSARDEERLREYAQQLLGALSDEGWSDEQLADAAYTLQVGREAMDERLALLADTTEEVKAKLAGYLEGRDDVEGLYRGQVQVGQVLVPNTDEDLVGTIETRLSKGKYGKLLELWVKGLPFDWNKLYGERKPKRISLPTYPFAKERYWVPHEGLVPVQALVQVLHPLLHRNTSDLSEQRFSTRFSGGEFFLSDHVVQGQKVLPGVAYLEMAREALVQGAGVAAGAGVRLKDVVWLRPFVVDGQAQELHVGLYPESDGSVGFEIYSGEDDVHSQGRAESFAAEAVRKLDLEVLRAQCARTTVSGSECYERFAALGLVYGPAHRAIEQLYVGEAQALARLVLPDSVLWTREQYVLHPSVLDATLQSVAGLVGEEGQGQLALPFAVQEVEVIGNCAQRMWALARPSAGSQAGDRVQKFDIDLCDDEGVVAVRIKGFATRVLEGGPGTVGEGAVETLQWRTWWQDVPVAHLSGKPLTYGERLVLLCDGKVDAERLSARLNARCERLPEDYTAQAGMLLSRLQALSRGKPGTLALVQVVVPTDGARQVSAGLAGLLKSARLENPKLIGQVIAVDGDEALESLASKLEENVAHPQDAQIRYAAGTRQVLGWSELKDMRPATPWKLGGVYLITGGLGGLGRIFAQEIAEQASGVTLVLTGRRELDDSGWRQVRELEALGAMVQYRSVDVADGDAVRQLVLQVQEEHEGLHGIVHSAGVLRDSLLMNKTADELTAVLMPKVAGMVNLDEASREIELDWFICFSSIAAVFGNVGQSDYAAGNGFMDAYAHYRNGLVERGLRHGRTVSVNWPLWREGGMRIDAAAERAMMQSTGLVALTTASGIEALYRVWGSGFGQVTVMEGDPARMRRMLAGSASVSALSSTASVSRRKRRAGAEQRFGGTSVSGQVSSLTDRDVRGAKGLPGAAHLESVIRAALASALGMEAGDLPADKPLQTLGYNSIAAMELKYQLETTLQRPVGMELIGDLGNTITDLVRLLIETAQEQMGTIEVADAAPVLPVLAPRPEARYEPFPLTEMQEAFLLGQHSNIDNDRIGAHIYLEIEVAGALDIFRLNRAWNRLVAHHDMLRAVIDGGNQQCVLPTVRDYRFKVADLRRLDKAERSLKADALRGKLEYRLYGEGEWPPFDIQVAIHEEGRYRIHFSINEMIADAQSVGTLLRQWDRLYADPGQALPPMELTFRDYVLAMKAYESSSKYQKDLAYWLERLEQLPAGPQLPQSEWTTQDGTPCRRKRLNYHLPAADWEALKAKATKLGVSPTALVLGVFVEVLRAWSANPAFTLVLTYFNRPPLHAQVRELIGPAISSLLFVVEPRNGDDFDAIVQKHDRCLRESLDHSSVSGVKALRQLRSRHGHSAQLALPVVFTSLLGSDVTREPLRYLGDVAYLVNQTPQVYLDHQLRESPDGLDGSWDVAEGHFAPGLVQALLAAYIEALVGLARRQWNWPAADPGWSGEQTDPATALLAEFASQARREDPLAPFPLSDQQQAYAFGRDTRFEGGGTSCQVYQELFVERLDVARLERALAALIEQHPMLRAIVDDSGNQSIQAQVPRYAIEVSDLGGLEPAERQVELAATRNALLGRVVPLGQWPYFTVTVSLLEDEMACIHLCFDMLIADSTCIGLLINELIRLYEQPQALPLVPQVTFRDYQRAVERFRNTPNYAERLAYWKRKFADLPGGPVLPQRSAMESATGQHQRISGELAQWGALKQYAAVRGIAPSLILLTAYLEVLFAWSDEQSLAVVVPGWERLPVHPDIDRVVGDFTTLSWVARVAEPMSFEARLSQVARQHTQDLAQRPVSGLQALRRVMLKDRRRQPRFPAVFTNQIMAHALPKGRFTLGQAITRTPQVYLDNISSEAGARLHCSWDFAGDVYVPTMIEEMFGGYLRLLELLGSDAQAWQRSDFDESIRARPAAYGGATDLAVLS